MLQMLQHLTGNRIFPRLVIPRKTSELFQIFWLKRIKRKRGIYIRAFFIYFYKSELTQGPFFVHFCLLFLLHGNCVLFRSHFYNMSISALTRVSHTGEKFFEKNCLQRGSALF